MKNKPLVFFMSLVCLAMLCALPAIASASPKYQTGYTVTGSINEGSPFSVGPGEGVESETLEGSPYKSASVTFTWAGAGGATEYSGSNVYTTGSAHIDSDAAAVVRWHLDVPESAVFTSGSYHCTWTVNGSGSLNEGSLSGSGNAMLWEMSSGGAYDISWTCNAGWSAYSGTTGPVWQMYVGEGIGGDPGNSVSILQWYDDLDPTEVPTFTPSPTVVTDLLEDGNMEEYPTSSAWDTYTIPVYMPSGVMGRMNDEITDTITSTVTSYLGSPYCDAGYQVIGGPVLTVSGTEVIPSPTEVYLPISQPFAWGGGTLYWRFAARAGAASGDPVGTANRLIITVNGPTGGTVYDGAVTDGWVIYEGSMSLPASAGYTLKIEVGTLRTGEYHFVDDVQLGSQPPTGHCGGGTGVGGDDEYSLLVDGGFELSANQGMQYWVKLPAYSDWPVFGRSVAQDLWWLTNYGGYKCGTQFQVVDFGSQGPTVGRMYPIRQRFTWGGGRLYYQAAARGDYRNVWGLGSAVGIYVTGTGGTYWLEQNRSVDHTWVWFVGSKVIPAGEYYFVLTQGSPAGTDPSGGYDLEFDEVAIGPKPFSGSCYTNGGPITPTPAGTVTPTPTLNPTSGVNVSIGDCSFENFDEFWVYAPGSWWTDYDYSPNQYILGEYFAVADGELPKPIYQTVFIPRSGMVRARFWSKSTYQLILVPNTPLSVPIVLATGGTYSGDLGAWSEIVTDPVWVNVPAAGMYADLVLSRDPSINGVYTQYTAMYDGVVLNIGPSPFGAVPGICGATNTPAPTYTYAPTLTPQGTFTATPSTRTPGPPGQNVADCDKKCNKPSGFGLDWVTNWLDYERCQVEYYAAWCPFHSATLAAVPTTFAGKEPFGMIVEVDESRGTVEAQVAQYDWNSAGIPGMEDQPDPSMFLVRTATPQGRIAAFYSAESTQYVSPYEGGQILLSAPQGYGESGEALSYSTYCNIQMADVIGSRLAVGACFGFNILRQLAILPWFQLFINLCSILALYFYIKTAWIDKGVG